MSKSKLAACIIGPALLFAGFLPVLVTIHTTAAALLFAVVSAFC